MPVQQFLFTNAIHITSEEEVYEILNEAYNYKNEIISFRRNIVMNIQPISKCEVIKTKSYNVLDKHPDLL